MTRHASFLETNGKSTKRGVHKGGSKMVTFGIRYKYGKLAWYKHTKPNCYKQSKQLVELINTGLKCKFSSSLHHLYAIREQEGVKSGEGCMGNSPFIGILITKDYNCNVHVDTNDFSYYFFIWLGNND